MPTIKTKFRKATATQRIQADVLAAVHKHAMAQDQIMSSYEAVATAREDLRELAISQRLAANDMISNAIELEQLATNVGVNLRDVEESFLPVSHI